MRLLTEWLLISVGGGILATVALSTLPDRWIDAPDDSAHRTADKVIATIFWPITLCVYLSGHGAPIGPPEKHMYEATPVQVLAVHRNRSFVGFLFQPSISHVSVAQEAHKGLTG